jgi:DNA-binding transcriptional LysR family regulator
LKHIVSIMRMPDFEAWAIFAAVAEQGSFSRAAEARMLSKASVSKAVTRLEAHIGAPLFYRTSRQVRLTQTGAMLADHARLIVSAAESAEEAAREEAVQPTGTVRITAPMSFGLSHVAPVVADFLQAYPGISADIELSDAQIDIIERQIDIAVRIGTLPDSSLRARKLRDVRVLLVASPAYVRAHPEPQNPAELNASQLICYSLAANETWHFTGPDGATAAASANGRLRVNNGDAMLPSLRGGHGIALLPDFLVEADLEAGHLQIVLPQWHAPPISLHLVTPPATVRPKRVELALAFLAERLKGEGSG